MTSVKFSCGLLICLLALLTSSLFGQTTSGNLTGTIVDSSGAVVADAEVTAKNNATSTETNTKSTGAGQYRLANLPSGSYVVTVKAPGFTTGQIQNVNVALNETATANLTLQVGSTSTSVDVTEAVAAIDTTTAQIQSTFQAKQLQDLPTTSIGSGVINASLLTAGVGSSGGIGQGTGPSVGGLRPEDNNFTVEGIDNNSKAVTGPLITIPNDAVAEFSLLANQYSPDFGHSAGGQFNQVVKSGSNQFHGSLYEYFENSNLNAADQLNAFEGNTLHPRLDRNRFGGTVGGPIKRNKMFFFVNYEYNPFGTTASTFYDAPTQAGYNTLAGIPGVNPTNLSTFQQYLGVAPVAAATADLPTQAPVTVGGVPVEVGQISSTLPSYQNTERAVAAFDYTISEKDSLRARFIVNRQGTIDTAGFPAAFFVTNPNNNYLITLSEYHTFSPTITNEFRLGYNRNFNTVGVTNQTFPGLDAFPNLAISELNVTNLGPDPNAPQFGIQNTYQATDNVSWTHGKHSFKFGFDGWKSISPQGFTQRGRGDYEYTNFSDYLFDNYPDIIAQRSIGNVTYYGDQFLLSGYGNDSWKILPNLTVNLGLRYEYQTVPYSERLQDLNLASSVPGVITFSRPRPQNDNFAPRIGIAYSPGTTGKTSIRAGFGRNYDVLYDNLGLLSLPPQFQRTVDVTGRAGTGFLAGGGIPANAQVTTPTLADLRTNTSGFIPNQKRPQAIQWNFGIQHVFLDNYTFEARYLGTRGVNLPVQTQLNIQPTVNRNNALPVYFTQPTQATLNSLTSTQASLEDAFNAGGNIVPSFLNAGFDGLITGYQPIGNSIYHGAALQLNRRFSNGLYMTGAYTWSHNIDDSTATVFSTILTPRRPQDSQDLRSERSSSALDHRQRLTYSVLYDVPFLKQGHNWFIRNLVSNWLIAPIYSYETGQLVTPQSQTDSNLNGDSAPDRVIVNPAGLPGVGTDTTALTNSSGDTVAFLANDPNARYVAAPRGTLATGGRSLFHLNPTNNVDLNVTKRFTVRERYSFELTGRAFNLFNHAQYTGSLLNDVGVNSLTGQIQRNVIVPGTASFADPSRGFSSNPRSLQLSLKFLF